MKDSSNNHTNSSARKPPVLPFKTLENYIDLLRDKTLPSHIDRSVLPTTMSGGKQVYLIATLKSLELISEEGVPSEIFHRLVSVEKNERAEIWRKILYKTYDFILNDTDIERTTTKIVVEKFRQQGMTGDTIRKAQTFFMHLAKEAGVKVSPHIKLFVPPTRVATKTSKSTPKKEEHFEGESTDEKSNTVNGRTDQGSKDKLQSKELTYQLVDILSPDMEKEEQDAVWTLIRYLKKQDASSE